MWRDAEQLLTLMWLFSWIPHSMCDSPPGKPRLTGCRSPEKETFTCWWEPGSSSGLLTRYQLYYRKENSADVFECPDYQKAGSNSCYFDKRHTAIWILYNITVVASNALGKAYSESVEVDVMDIVQPHPPENVNVTLKQTENSQYVLVQWQPPHDVDTSSGWVTIKYEVRSKIQDSRDEEDSSWESYSAGKQLEFSIYSPQPRTNYVVQVRCKLDQGLWSEWSPSAFIQIPGNATETQNAAVIFAITFTVVIFLLTAGVLTFKKKQVKHFLLPPVPVPKISGLDTQLLKSGRTEEIFSALTTPGYPQISLCADRQVEYLIVSDWDEDILIGQAHFEYQNEKNCPKNDTHVTGICGLEVHHQLSDLGEPQILLHLDSDGSPIKAHDRNTQTSSYYKNKHASISSSGPTGYVEVDRNQKPLLGEDYSIVSDVINDNILVLEDSIPVQVHKEAKCVKTSGVMESEGVIEPL